MPVFTEFIRNFYQAIAQIGTRFLMLEIIPGLHMFSLVILGVLAMIVTFFLTGGEST